MDIRGDLRGEQRLGCERYEVTEVPEPEAEVAFGFEGCPERVVADAGEFTTVEVVATLTTRNNLTGTIPKGYTLGLGIEGGEIDTVERLWASFASSYAGPAVHRDDNERIGAIAAAIFSLAEPPNPEIEVEGTARLARITVKVPRRPGSECVPVTFRYEDGFQGTVTSSNVPVPLERRAPVENLVSFPPRFAKKPELGSCTILVCPAAPAFLRGDCNDDGAVNIADAQYLLNFLFLGGPKPPCEAASDINDDGAANIADAQYLLNFLFLGGPGPDRPYPDCGPDPQGETLGCERSTCQ